LEKIKLDYNYTALKVTKENVDILSLMRKCRRSISTFQRKASLHLQEETPMAFLVMRMLEGVEALTKSKE